MGYMFRSGGAACDGAFRFRPMAANSAGKTVGLIENTKFMFDAYRRWQVVTWIIIGNAAVHLIKVVLLALDAPGPLVELVLSPHGMASGHVWQLLTYMWLHADAWHLLFNMAGLHFLGRPVEERLGTARFLWLYLMGGFVGGVLWWLANLRGEGFVLGASGAVLAVVMAFAVLYPRAPLVLFPIPIQVQARWLAVFYVVFSAVLALEQGGRIAHAAHLGGLIVGFVYIRALGIAREPMFWWRGFGWPRFARPRREEGVVPPRTEWGPATSDEVDAILDKISEHGFQSLTPREKEVLERASGRK